MTTPYNQLRQLLTDRLPHLKELSFGCEVYHKMYGRLLIISEDDTYAKIYNTTSLEQLGSTRTIMNDYEIIGHLPTLSDLLLAIKKKGEYVYIESGTINDIIEIRITGIGHFEYDLTKPLADQDSETLLAIISLLQ